VFNSPLRGTPAKRVFSWGWEGEFELDSWTEDEIDGEVFDTSTIPFTDLDAKVTHNLHLEDFNNLPPTI